MLYTLKEIFNKYKDSAIASFNVYNLETIQAVANAAKLEDKPVIFAFGESYFRYANIEDIAFAVKRIVKELELDAVLHLDHAKKIESIRLALNNNFTSVMYDGSALILDENIRNTIVARNLSKDFGASLEAEIGYLNSEDGNEDYIISSKDFTDRNIAKEFSEKTSVDALAISVGNVHGIYKGTPSLDLQRIKEIYELVNIPLVLHGSSGIDEYQINMAIKNGIRKINVNTDLAVCAVGAMKERINKSNRPERLEKLLEIATREMQSVARKYIRMINSNN
ncbi:class II fructose-bisphosphate aldolase [Natronincola ferrireducens]|uniref:Fructose-bisphosphate aldolase, class II n=1 Tax=Natronincola ferrireducens TaxID=393762 RepID=A0A1G9GF02_9FIRM|nr:class II fructose-bisphosphate aldolase [Natronincola ferrireducens]SDK99246.1 fructose-bisphosphate aldolase, class II [Natronincola ferrireducens]